MSDEERNGIVKMYTIYVGKNLSYLCVDVRDEPSSSGPLQTAVEVDSVPDTVSISGEVDTIAHIAADTQSVLIGMVSYNTNISRWKWESHDGYCFCGNGARDCTE